MRMLLFNAFLWVFLGPVANAATIKPLSFESLFECSECEWSQEVPQLVLLSERELARLPAEVISKNRSLTCLSNECKSRLERSLKLKFDPRGTLGFYAFPDALNDLSVKTNNGSFSIGAGKIPVSVFGDGELATLKRAILADRPLPGTKLIVIESDNPGSKNSDSRQTTIEYGDNKKFSGASLSGTAAGQIAFSESLGDGSGLGYLNRELSKMDAPQLVGRSRDHETLCFLMRRSSRSDSASIWLVKVVRGKVAMDFYFKALLRSDGTIRIWTGEKSYHSDRWTSSLGQELRGKTRRLFFGNNGLHIPIGSEILEYKEKK